MDQRDEFTNEHQTSRALQSEKLEMSWTGQSSGLSRAPAAVGLELRSFPGPQFPIHEMVALDLFTHFKAADVITENTLQTL